MADLLLRDLVNATGGRVTFASMPPRDGELLMLRRSTPIAAEVRYGDLFWALRLAGDDGMQHVEEAFARGAAGAVICGRAIEPWAGKFTVTVTNVREALWRAASLARARFEGAVICAIADSSAGPLLHRELGSGLSGSLASSTDSVSASDLAALGLLNAHPSHDYLVIELGSDVAEAVNIAHRVCPHVLVAPAASPMSSVVPLLESLPDEGRAVLSFPELERILKKSALSVFTTVGNLPSQSPAGTGVRIATPSGVGFTSQINSPLPDGVLQN